MASVRVTKMKGRDEDLLQLFFNSGKYGKARRSAEKARGEKENMCIFNKMAPDFVFLGGLILCGEGGQDQEGLGAASSSFEASSRQVQAGSSTAVKVNK